jgi:hypothetical protein
VSCILSLLQGLGPCSGWAAYFIKQQNFPLFLKKTFSPLTAAASKYNFPKQDLSELEK